MLMNKEGYLLMLDSLYQKSDSPSLFMTIVTFYRLFKDLIADLIEVYQNNFG